MIALFIILGILILVFLGVITYFFALAFVKQNMGDYDDVNSPVNIPLGEYKETVKRGIDFINSEPCEWVYTTSFDGLKLAARYFNRQSDKTIILFHGYRSSATRDFSCAVQMYLSHGFNVLLCDQRSHGRSEGKLITFGVKERKDVVTWAELAVAKFGAKQLLLDGMSMGATTVLLACELELPKEVKGIIADCGFTSPVDIINKVARDSFKINATYFLPFLNLFCLLFGNFSIYGVSTEKALKNSDIPVLFVHGKDDNFVPCEMSQRGYSAACDKCRILLVEGAGHGLSYLVDKKSVDNEIKCFLSENFS